MNKNKNNIKELISQLFEAIDKDDLQFYIKFGMSPYKYKIDGIGELHEALRNAEVVIYKTEEAFNLLNVVLSESVKGCIGDIIKEKNTSHTLVRVGSEFWTTLEMQQARMDVWFNKSKEIMREVL